MTTTDEQIRAELIGALPGNYPWHEVVDVLMPTVRRLIAEGYVAGYVAADNGEDPKVTP